MNGTGRLAGLLLTIGFLAGCGADGEPIAPAQKVTTSAAISLSSSGIHTSAALGIAHGPLTIRLGF